MPLNFIPFHVRGDIRLPFDEELVLFLEIDGKEMLESASVEKYP
jgi:hypothetical protein